MDHLLPGRKALEMTLAAGGAVSPQDASLFPDVILRNSGADVPDWLLPHMRRPNQSNKARYVVAENTPFHVSQTHAGPVVSQVINFEKNGVHKIVHEPYCINDSKYYAALKAYELVNDFIADPNKFRDLFSTPSDYQQTKPAENLKKRNNRVSTRH